VTSETWSVVTHSLALTVARQLVRALKTTCPENSEFRGCRRLRARNLAPFGERTEFKEPPRGTNTGRKVNGEYMCGPKDRPRSVSRGPCI